MTTADNCAPVLAFALLVMHLTDRLCAACEYVCRERGRR